MLEDSEENRLFDSAEDCLVLVPSDEIVSTVVEVVRAVMWDEDSKSPVTDAVAL